MVTLSFIAFDVREPAVGLRKISELAIQQRYQLARQLSRVLRFLHPTPALRLQAELLRALDLAQTGELSSALNLLGRLENNETNVGRQATAQSFRLRGEWENLVGWIRNEVPAAIRRSDFALMPLYLRALGECGMRDELVLEFGTMLAVAAPSQQPAWSYYAGLRTVLAFCGRLGVRGGLAVRRLPRDQREFWIATDEIAAGNISAARTRLQE